MIDCTDSSGIMSRYCFASPRNKEDVSERIFLIFASCLLVLAMKEEKKVFWEAKLSKKSLLVCSFKILSSRVV